MYDHISGPTKYGYEMFHYNTSIKPIWIANQLAGKYSGCMMWPGHEYEYNGINCTFSVRYNRTSGWNERVDVALSWFVHSKTPANLVMFYLNEPDGTSHAYSPNSNNVSKKYFQFYL